MNAPAPPLKTAAGEAFSLTPFALSHGDTLRHLAAHPGASHLDIAAATGRDSSNARRDLAKLVSTGLVDTGHHLTEPGKLAVDAMERLELAEGAARGDQLKILHHHIAPNPLNPRQAFADIEALADTIEATGDVLQNLVVFPPDAEGIHVLADGERRWRAVGLLIDQGRWPKDRPLPCRQREHDESQTDFLALIANGQRQNLSILEEARAYLRLTEAQGWSAREAALKTGRDVRTVQEMLKVLREAPAEAIGWCEQGRFTWEELRGLVRTPKAPEPPPAVEPEQRDIEEIAAGAPAPDPRIEHFSQAVHEAALVDARRERGHDRVVNACLSGKTTIEGEAWPETSTETLATDWSGYPNAEIRLTQSSAGRWHVSLSTQAGGPSYSYQGAPPYVYSLDPIFRSRDDALDVAAEAVVDRLGDWGKKRKLTAWLEFIRSHAPPPAEPAREPAERPGLTGDAFSRQLHEAVDEAPAHLTEFPPEITEEITQEELTEDIAEVRLIDAMRLAEAWTRPSPWRFPPMIPQAPQEADFAAVLAGLGARGPFGAESGENSGGVFAANGEEICTVDVNRELPNAAAEAIALLIATALNVCAGLAQPSDGPQP